MSASEKIHPLIKDGEIKKPPKVLPKLSYQDILKSFPPHLKDPKNFKKIQQALLETLASNHSHSEMEGWAKCKKCMQKMENHKLMMLKLGFITPAHYRIWLKIHTEIGKRVPLIAERW